MREGPPPPGKEPEASFSRERDTAGVSGGRGACGATKAPSKHSGPGVGQANPDGMAHAHLRVHDSYE